MKMRNAPNSFIYVLFVTMLYIKELPGHLAAWQVPVKELAGSAALTSSCCGKSCSMLSYLQQAPEAFPSKGKAKYESRRRRP